MQPLKWVGKFEWSLVMGKTVLSLTEGLLSNEHCTLNRLLMDAMGITPMAVVEVTLVCQVL